MLISVKNIIIRFFRKENMSRQMKHFMRHVCHNIYLQLYFTSFYIIKIYLRDFVCVFFFNINILANDHFRLTRREINNSTRIQHTFSFPIFIQLLHNAKIPRRVKESHVVSITAYSGIHKSYPRADYNNGDYLLVRTRNRQFTRFFFLIRR